MDDPQDSLVSSTVGTWIEKKLLEGDQGRLDVNRHIMDTYARWLKVYFLGSSFKRLGDVDEFIAGFFADRLGRDGYFRQWRVSGKRLRYWLLNGFVFYLKEQRRVYARQVKAAALDADLVADSGLDRDAEREMDRAFVVELVRKALELAEARCGEEGLSAHWQVFLRHSYQGWSYERVHRETGLAADRATTMNRTAKDRFQAAVRELLDRDGASPEDIDGEVQTLLQIDGGSSSREAKRKHPGPASPCGWDDRDETDGT